MHSALCTMGIGQPADPTYPCPLVVQRGRGFTPESRGIRSWYGCVAGSLVVRTVRIPARWDTHFFLGMHTAAPKRIGMHRMHTVKTLGYILGACLVCSVGTCWYATAKTAKKAKMDGKKLRTKIIRKLSEVHFRGGSSGIVDAL